jgi:hypothetical protein
MMDNWCRSIAWKCTRSAGFNLWSFVALISSLAVDTLVVLKVARYIKHIETFIFQRPTEGTWLEKLLMAAYQTSREGNARAAVGISF